MKAKFTAERFTCCPECGALPCDWGNSPSREGSAHRVISEAVALYGKVGGPWNDPHNPGHWIESAKAWLSEAEGVAA